MKVFISFSGQRSQALAEILRKHIPHIIDVDLFLSQSDIEPGARWAETLTTKLEETDYGILVLTPDNLKSEWLHFEAGALTKHREGRACTLIFDDVKFANVEGPLAQFHHCEFTQEGFQKLIAYLNKKTESPMSDEILTYRLIKPWTDMNQEIKAIPASSEEKPAPPKPRGDESKTDEMLTILRALEREVTRANMHAAISRALDAPPSGTGIDFHDAYLSLVSMRKELDAMMPPNGVGIGNTLSFWDELTAADRTTLTNMVVSGAPVISSGDKTLLMNAYLRGVLMIDGSVGRLSFSEAFRTAFITTPSDEAKT